MPPILYYIIRRILAVLPVMAVVAVVVFAMLRLTPGDPAAIIAGDNATQEQLQQIRNQMGLDDPIWLQLAVWAGRLLHGDLGTSLISGSPVAEMIGQRLGPTMSLAVLTIVFSVLVAVPLGVFAAWKHGKTMDRGVMAFSVLGFSVPTFVTGYVLIWIFSIKLGWLPVQGYRPLSAGLWPFLECLILPCAALSTVYVALIARMTRTSMVEVMGEDYIRTARSKGVSERVVLLGHALRNAAIPILTTIGVGIAMLIGGVVITESVFNIPGIGRLVMEAVLARDYPVIQGLILFFAFVYVLINLVIDLLYTVFDPRVTY